jgi:hypothetical protein
MKTFSKTLALGALAGILSAAFFAQTAFAQALSDADADGLPDAWEVSVFATDPAAKDTDGDGYDDLTEIKNGFDPLGKGAKVYGDYDGDGLLDRYEILFGADPTAKDTDGDGYLDGQEVSAGYSPASASKTPLEKKIVISLKKQSLQQVLGGVVLATYPVSTGRPGYATPTGEFKVMNKNPRAWSSIAKLWMPWWMQFTSGGVGLHELPEWPSGKKEGERSLGTPASGCCVRLGVGPAKQLYDWTPVGTRVIVTR